MIPYSYVVLRYVHDAVAGESVNVGLLFYAPEARYVRFYRDGRYGHLSHLFFGFEPDHYRRILGWIESAVEKFQHSLLQSQAQLFEMSKFPGDASAFVRQLTPDNGLSFQWSQAGAGITRRVQTEAEAIFDRFVISQRSVDKSHKRRDDTEVWTAYSDILGKYSITRVLRPGVVATSGFELQLEHTFRNEKLHAIEPMSFDYQDTSSIREKAAKWMGYGVALKENKDFSKLYLLLGKPVLPSHLKDYVRAKDFLRTMPIRPELIEEDEAEDFAKSLADYMREHGVLSPETKVSTGQTVDHAKGTEG